MKYLLDTNACIAIMTSRYPSVETRLRQVGAHNAAICSVVVAELLHGLKKSHPSRRSLNHQVLEIFRQRLPSLPFGDDAAEHYGDIAAHLASLGTPIGPNDLIIASIALANNLTLITHNTAEFSRIPALQLEDWQ